MKDLRAKSFVSIMIFIVVSTLLLRLAISQVIKISIPQNESSARATLKLISIALENYAKDNKGVYPDSLEAITQTNPPYLDKDYLSHSAMKGYNYSCPRFDPSGYSCIATPDKCKISGTKVYTIDTGGLLIAEECGKKE
ncbi:MAG: hypothetical protein NC923_03035 [Candidatus Omnitrophica bacterium]|nr:hypothetical protein [Candidatus Omnitrophota bacterium]